MARQEGCRPQCDHSDLGELDGDSKQLPFAFHTITRTIAHLARHDRLLHISQVGKQSARGGACLTPRHITRPAHNGRLPQTHHNNVFSIHVRRHLVHLFQ